jgi:hypothetical protein
LIITTTNLNGSIISTSNTMSPPSFLDKLAPELRVQIYGHIFGTSNTIKPSDSTASLGVDKSELNPAALIANPHTPLESSILATNKLIFREAVQVLYHNRVIRATLIDLKQLLQDKDFVANVESVEITDCWNGVKSVSCSGILDNLHELPRIRSIVILSDCLSIAGSKLGTPTTFMIVPRFIRHKAGLGHATCVDIGRYQLHGKYSRVHVVDRRLTKMWPSAQSVPAGYDAWADLDAIMQRWKLRVHVRDRMRLALQTSFRCWVGLHEEVVLMRASGKILELRNQTRNGTISETDAAKLDLADRYMKAAVGLYLPLEFFMQDPKLRSLRDLMPGDDPTVLSRATEYLALNITTFRREPDRQVIHRAPNLVTAHWAEADGGLDVVEEMIEQQELAFAGLPSASYILDPVRSDRLIESSLVRDHIKGAGFERLISPAALAALEPMEFMQFAHLSIAANPAYSLVPRRSNKSYGKELDAWAIDLLKRHLLASKCSDPSMIQDMSLEDLRKSLSLLLQRPSLSKARTDPPEDLDPDLFVPLAWSYGWQYANICADQHEAGLEVEEGSDWDEEYPASDAESDEEEDEGEEE